MARPLKALTKETATGNGAANTADMIRLSSSVLGSVSLLRRDMNRRFGEQALSNSIVEGKLDTVAEKVRQIEEDRRLTTALELQAKNEAKEAAKEAKDTTSANNADRAAHSLSRNQRWAIVVAAGTGCGGLLLSNGFAALIANVARFLGGHS